ncbi:MAG: endonuclease/exonuclease/phosphatase family protein [Pseudomonadota bacterium]|nr:endonuclease/exonuclease/phosphatase family protein [Pseudomonadota bacterium]
MIIFEILAGLVVIATVMAWVPRNEWWFRGFDFPRLQIIAIAVVSALGLLLWPAPWDTLRWMSLLTLLGCTAYQVKMVLPYTRLWPKQVLLAREIQPKHQVSLLVSNVLTPNPNKQALIDLVCQHEPDILITLESDQVWEDALQVIEPDYPYVVRVPLDNLYGMHLYSRLPLIAPEVKFLLSPEIPSIHTQVKLRCGKKIWLYCLHPKPPSPTEAKDSTLRDAELLIVGDHIEKKEQTCIVAGDLNDVAWSRTTRLFQRISGLLDPRVGRQFVNTFHVDYPFLRWSLDHVFHSTDFSLIDMRRLPSVGSDHFPVLTRLHFDPKMDELQDEVESSAADEKEAAERIEDGVTQAREEHPQHFADPI